MPSIRNDAKTNTKWNPTRDTVFSWNRNVKNSCRRSATRLSVGHENLGLRLIQVTFSTSNQAREKTKQQVR